MLPGALDPGCVPPAVCRAHRVARRVLRVGIADSRRGRDIAKSTLLTRVGHRQPIFALMSVVKRGRRGSASSPTICVGSYRGYDRATVGAKMVTIHTGPLMGWAGRTPAQQMRLKAASKSSAIQTTPNRQRGDIRAIPQPVKLAPLKDRTR
jgi:hypothetical protein